MPSKKRGLSGMIILELHLGIERKILNGEMKKGWDI